MSIEFRSVKAKDGSDLLFDIYVNGKWFGSRRTMAQCEEVPAVREARTAITDRAYFDAITERSP